MTSEAVTIYHNPRCGTSRNTLAMIRATGIEPTIIEYLKTPLERAQLQALGVPPRKLLRAKEPLSIELGLGDPGRSEEELLDAMAAHPQLMNRPVVVTARGATLCRPSERVLEILPRPLPAHFTKEDGEVIQPPEA